MQRNINKVPEPKRAAGGVTVTVEPLRKQVMQFGDLLPYYNAEIADYYEKRLKDASDYARGK